MFSREFELWGIPFPCLLYFPNVSSSLRVVCLSFWKFAVTLWNLFHPFSFGLWSVELVCLWLHKAHRFQNGFDLWNRWNWIPGRFHIFERFWFKILVKTDWSLPKCLKMKFENALPIVFFLSAFYFFLLLLVYFQKNGNNIKTHGCYSVLSSIFSYLLSNFYSCCFFLFFFFSEKSRLPCLTGIKVGGYAVIFYSFFLFWCKVFLGLSFLCCK